MADDYNSVFSQPDPRKFVVVHCDNKAELRRNQLDQTKSNGFVSGLSKLAGIAGTGVVQEGLSAIVKTVGVGGRDWEKLVDGGATGILSTVMGDQATNVLSGLMQKINPGAINKGISQAKNIHDKVKERDFNWRDIPQYVADFKNLYTIGSSIIDPFLSAGGGPDVTHTMCSASPYATDLIKQGVKFKFLFVVEFKFYTEYANLLGIEPSFVVKTSDRPSVVYEYEDINMYNFRTKVAKKSTFTPISMSFHDDEQNRAVAFYNAMQRLMTPIANHLTPAMYENSGMEYHDIGVDATGKDSGAQGIGIMDHAASIGPLLGSNTSIIQSINLYHVYMGGSKVNEYQFINPRVLNMNLDGMDMSAGETSELKMEFAYDNVVISNYVSPGMVVGKDNEDGAEYPLGRANWGPGGYPASSEVPTSVGGAGGASSGFPLAEAMGRGESFIEGLISGAAGLGSSVASAIGGTIGTLGTRMTSVGDWINSPAATGSTPVAAPSTPWTPPSSGASEAQIQAAAAADLRANPGLDPRLADSAARYPLSDRSTYWLNWEKENGRITE